MKRLKLTLALGFVVMMSVVSARAQTPADAAAIKQTALDYIEGWYEGNAERIEKALHPDLAKRIVRTNPRNNRSFVSGWKDCRERKLRQDGEAVARRMNQESLSCNMTLKCHWQAVTALASAPDGETLAGGCKDMP